MNGIRAFLEVLAASGVNHIFGNPGTTELPFNDALATDDRFQYFFGIHEIPVVAMADGYAQASRKIGVANVHISCGLGNSMGMLYNAHIEGTPLLLTAGQQDRRLRFEEPVLEGDLVSVAQPWTKWSAEVQRVEDIPCAVRRALQTALTPPTGPVFLSLPLDVQLEETGNLDLSPASIPDHRIRPPKNAILRAAELLGKAAKPGILAGSRVVECEGVPELVAVSEMLGAPVFSECATSHGRLPMPADHPLYAGLLPLWTPQLRERLAEFDVLLVVGINVFRQYIFQESDSPLSPHTKLIQLDNDPWQVGKNYPVEVGLVGNPKCGLAELGEMVGPQLKEGQKKKAKSQYQLHLQRRKSEQQELRSQIEQQFNHRPMSPLVMMSALAKVLPDNAVVVEEAATSHLNLLERLGVLKDPTGHFGHRGWALGWGLGCALGVKLAWPDRSVISLLGDGAALYGIQGLWSAAHHNIPVTFIICNNSEYQILKVCGNVLSLPNLSGPKAEGMNLSQPKVDFVGLAKSFGMDAKRCESPEMLADLVHQSLARETPLLIDVPLSQEVSWK